MERASARKGWRGEGDLKKMGENRRGKMLGEEGSSCAGGFEEDLVLTGVTCNRYGAGIKAGICHRKVCSSSIEKIFDT